MTVTSQRDCGYTGSRLYSYNRGCRCDTCRAARSSYLSSGAVGDRNRAASRAWKDANRERYRESDRTYRRARRAAMGRATGEYRP